MKWSNYNNIIVFILESEQRCRKKNVAKCVHFSHKWNTHYGWSKYIQRGAEWEERRNDDARTVFHSLKGQEQRKRTLQPRWPVLMSSSSSQCEGDGRENRAEAEFHTGKVCIHVAPKDLRRRQSQRGKKNTQRETSPAAWGITCMKLQLHFWSQEFRGVFNTGWDFLFHRRYINLTALTAFMSSYPTSSATASSVVMFSLQPSSFHFQLTNRFTASSVPEALNRFSETRISVCLLRWSLCPRSWFDRPQVVQQPTVAHTSSWLVWLMCTKQNWDGGKTSAQFYDWKWTWNSSQSFGSKGFRKVWFISDMLVFVVHRQLSSTAMRWSKTNNCSFFFTLFVIVTAEERQDEQRGDDM